MAKHIVVSNIGIALLPEITVKANITHDLDAEIGHTMTQRDISRSIVMIWRKKSPRTEALGVINTALTINWFNFLLISG